MRAPRPHDDRLPLFLGLTLVCILGAVAVYLVAVHTELGQRVDTHLRGGILQDENPVAYTATSELLDTISVWSLALMGATAFVLGSGIRMKATDPGDLLWGLGLGLITGGGLMLVGWDTLAVTAERLFAMGQGDSALLNTWIFQATAFVMPLSESLFFRGAMQRVHSIPTVALLASAWSMLMFFPNLGLSEAPVVGFVIGTALVVLNFLYSYVNYRHGLAASIGCQVVAGTLLLLAPRLLAG